ncbi:MAG: mobile mystery protein B [Mariniphaga sp.]
MGLDFDYTLDQTPLDEDEKEGLLIPTIATRSELDEFEQQNIEDTIHWVLARSFKPMEILTEKFAKNLHRRMYGNVWGWAGKFRKTNKNIGVDKWAISSSLKNLFDDTTFWTEHNTFEPDEIAIRFKHRLVCIHCFPNGNGRHSRLMADVIIDKIFKRPVFSWGASSFLHQSDARTTYLKALREADKNNYQQLISFARS